VSLYKFCQENCLAGTSGALVEVKRGEFQLVGEADSQMLRSLRSACLEAGGRFKERKFHLEEISQADGFAATVRRMGIEVHTLKEHVEALSSYLQIKKERLKEITDFAEKTAPEMPIMTLDPLTRRWKPSRLDKVDKIGGAVLRDPSGFYIARYGTIAKVSEEDAYLFALLFLYREKSITVIMDESRSFIGVKLSDIGNLPESVFYTLVRLQPTLRKGSLVMMFYRADMDTVFRTLRLAKLIPVIATGIARLTHKLGVKEVEVVSPHIASKEASLLLKVFNAIGYIVSYADQYIEVELGGGSVRIYLANSGKYLSGLLSDGAKAIFVPLRYLITADRALSAFKLIRTYGFSIITAEHWARVLEKLCELAEGKAAGASKLAEEALLASRSKPEILTALASNPTVRAAASRLIELATQGKSGTPLDGLPLEELFAIWRRISETPLP
jgi:hypothetical protein